jgi:hypothetical protein
MEHESLEFFLIPHLSRKFQNPNSKFQKKSKFQAPRQTVFPAKFSSVISLTPGGVGAPVTISN